MAYYRRETVVLTSSSSRIEASPMFAGLPYPGLAETQDLPRIRRGSGLSVPPAVGCLCLLRHLGRKGGRYLRRWPAFLAYYRRETAVHSGPLSRLSRVVCPYLGQAVERTRKAGRHRSVRSPATASAVSRSRRRGRRCLAPAGGCRGAGR